MTQPGLMQISPELVEILRQCTDDRRHQIVERACLLAVQRADVADPMLTKALEAIRRRNFGILVLRGQVDALTQKLDEIAWEIQDQFEAGNAPESQYHRAFAKARAAAAIEFALDGSLAASFDALYEAYYAIDNRDDFMHVVVD